MSEKCVECDKPSTMTMTINNGEETLKTPLCDEHYEKMKQEIYAKIDIYHSNDAT